MNSYLCLFISSLLLNQQQQQQHKQQHHHQQQQQPENVFKYDFYFCSLLKFNDNSKYSNTMRLLVLQDFI